MELGLCVRLNTVNCYDVPLFDFQLHKCCKSGVTAANQLGFAVRICRFPPVIFSGLIQFCTGRNVVVHDQEMKFFFSIPVIYCT